MLKFIEYKLWQYYTVEEPVRRKIFTSSSVVAGSKLKGFEVIPEEIDFGVVREGLAYTFKFYLKNAGIDFSRFKIKQPPPSTGIKVIYNPGPVSLLLLYCTTIIMYCAGGSWSHLLDNCGVVCNCCWCCRRTCSRAYSS